MNRRVTFSILTVVLLLAMLVVSACGGKEEEEKVTIVYWSMFSEGEPLMQLLDAATKDFMTENPNITVEINWAGRQVLTQLQSAIAAETQVDIVDHSDDRVYNAIVKNDLALPLDEYLDQKAYDSDMAWKDTFKPGALEIGKHTDGHYYLIPRDDYISAFFYNVKMLKELGIEPNASGMTWDEFVAMLDKIEAEKPGVSPLGADGPVSFYNNWYFAYLATRIVGKDAFRDAAYDKTGESWGDPGFLQAAQMIEQIQPYFQDGYEGSVWPAAQVQWVNSEIAMMFCGAWLPKEMSEQTPEGFEISLFGFPTVDGGKGNDLVEHWANTYGVLASTKHPEAVAKYLQYIMSKKVGTNIANLGTPVPLEGVPVPPALANQFVILGDHTAMPARAGLNTEIPEYMENVFNVCVDKHFLRQVDSAGFIDCLKTESASYWARTG
jgi:raffinose/stachyose/melibiose transport system substrate-binding protein